MSRIKHRNRHHGHLSENGRVAAMLLPPTPLYCPPYTKLYYESFRGQLFQACSNKHHRNCPRTSDRAHEHLYCLCPCHRKDLTRYQKRKMWDQLKKEMLAKATRQRKHTSSPRTKGVRTTGKRFRYVKASGDHVPAGIMRIVHGAIAQLKEGSLADVAAACDLEIRKISKQDPVTQTNIMLHRLLKAGVVEVV